MRARATTSSITAGRAGRQAGTTSGGIVRLIESASDYAAAVVVRPEIGGKRQGSPINPIITIIIIA